MLLSDVCAADGLQSHPLLFLLAHAWFSHLAMRSLGAGRGHQARIPVLPIAQRTVPKEQTGYSGALANASNAREQVPRWLPDPSECPQRRPRANWPPGEICLADLRVLVPRPIASPDPRKREPIALAPTVWDGADNHRMSQPRQARPRPARASHRRHRRFHR